MALILLGSGLTGWIATRVQQRNKARAEKNNDKEEDA